MLHEVSLRINSALPRDVFSLGVQVEFHTIAEKFASRITRVSKNATVLNVPKLALLESGSPFDTKAKILFECIATA